MKSKISLTTISVLATLGVFSQTTEVAGRAGISSPLLWIIYFVIGLLLLITYILYLGSKELKRYVKGGNETVEAKMWDSRSSWEKIFQIKPLGTDKDTLIDEPHDGIYELDNPPPPWFMFLFYVWIAFAVVYTGRFLLTDMGYTQEEEYLAEMQAAEKQIYAHVSDEDLSIDENNIIALSEASAISSGKKLFVQNCKVCHGDGAKGIAGSGPNLTDAYWKHGGGAKNIFKTIKYGVIEKGMAPWKETLSPKKIQEVVSYIISLEGTNPAGAKEPEGDLWEEPENTEKPADSTSNKDVALR